MKKSIILLLAVVLLGSCQSGNDKQTVTIEDRYSLSIPSFLVKVDNLNENASLQYQHAVKEFYVIVIDEPKSELSKALEENDLEDMYANNIKGYSELLTDGLERNITVAHRSTPVSTTINNMPAVLTTISGQVSGVDIFYSIAFIEGKDQYYQVMAWTLLKKENQYKSMMNEIMYTFKEL